VDEETGTAVDGVDAAEAIEDEAEAEEAVATLLVDEGVDEALSEHEDDDAEAQVGGSVLVTSGMVGVGVVGEGVETGEAVDGLVGERPLCGVTGEDEDEDEEEAVSARELVAAAHDEADGEDSAVDAEEDARTEDVEEEEDEDDEEDDDAAASEEDEAEDAEDEVLCPVLCTCNSEVERGCTPAGFISTSTMDSSMSCVSTLD
jgi:hypothetical protein